MQKDETVHHSAEPITPLTLKQEYEEMVGKDLAAIRSDPEKCEAAAQRLKTEADQLFSDDSDVSKYRMAFRYQAAARIYESLAESATDVRHKRRYYESAGSLYHFSGHAFRKQEEYRWSGNSYAQSGACFQKQFELLADSGKKERVAACENAIRSYSRAKGVYGEVGDFHLSGETYLIEQKLRQEFYFLTDFRKGVAFAIWGTMTGYGESLGRWFSGYLIGILAFAIALRISPGVGWRAAFVTSVERSMLIPGPDSGTALLVAQFAYAYFNLGLGLSLITRKMATRG